MQSLRLGRLAALFSVVLVVATVTSCSTASNHTTAASGSSGSSGSSTAPTVKTFAPRYTGKPTLTPDMADDGPGSLVSITPYDKGSAMLDDDGVTYMRAVYRSTSGVDGKPTEVSAVLAIPAGKPPKGGWPIMGFGQGTKGVLFKCASSLFATLPKQDWSIDQFIQAGYAVAATDYQGSGVKGVLHPFLDAKTYGYNVIDSVRALRKVGGDLVSDKWVAYGHSAGGLAVWSAAEQAPDYGKGLNLLGTISMAPAVNMAGLADAAWNGTLTLEQRTTMVYALQSIKWFHPEMNLDDFRGGVVAANWDLILDCAPKDLAKMIPMWEHVLKTMTNADLRPKTYEDLLWLRNIMAQRATLNTRRIESPLAVAYGTQDELVDEPWFVTELKKACAMGSNMEITKEPGKGHGDIDQAFVMSWLGDRLAGIPPPPSNCADWLKGEAPK